MPGQRAGRAPRRRAPDHRSGRHRGDRHRLAPSGRAATTASERVVHLADGHRITARAVIVATGIAWRRLGVPRLEALVGTGVFYGAAGSETLAMEGRDVHIVGAGNSAGQTALHLARYARQ